MDELLKQLGPQGILAVVVAIGAVFWRVKLPAIGVEYLSRELERYRAEIEASDKERVEMREAIKIEIMKGEAMERDYLRCLADREKCRQHIRFLERQLRQLGQAPVEGEEERA